MEISVAVNKRPLVVYTVHVREKEPLREPAFVHPDADYVCYTDDPDFTSPVWKPRPVVFYKRDPVRTAKFYKLLCHRHFLDYKASIYHDASFQLQSDPFLLIEAYLGDADMSLHPHYLRHCLYEEIEACIQLYKDRIGLLRAQGQAYKQQGFPEDQGLYECGILMRHHNKRVSELNEKWWEEIVRYSARDQISFPVVLSDSSVKLNLLPFDNIRHNPDFDFIYPGLRPHPRYRHYLAARRILGWLKRKCLFFFKKRQN